MTYAPDPTYAPPHAGWTEQNKHRGAQLPEPGTDQVTEIPLPELTSEDDPPKRKPRARRP